MQGPIVVGADATENSRLAVNEAASIASATGQELVIVFVRRTPLAGLSVFAPVGGKTVEQALDQDQALAEAQVATLLGTSTVHWSFAAARGDPATELMRMAERTRAAMIVIAGRRHTAIGSVACNAVATQLLHRWDGSLLVVHPPAEMSYEPDKRTVSP